MARPAQETRVHDNGASPLRPGVDDYAIHLSDVFSVCINHRFAKLDVHLFLPCLFAIWTEHRLPHCIAVLLPGSEEGATSSFRSDFEEQVDRTSETHLAERAFPRHSEA